MSWGLRESPRQIFKALASQRALQATSASAEAQGAGHDQRNEAAQTNDAGTLPAEGTTDLLPLLPLKRLNSLAKPPAVIFVQK